MGIRFDSALGLFALGVVFVGFGLFRLADLERSGWLLIGGGVLAIAGAWRRLRHPPEK
jgi:hypothetical protein